MKKYRIGVDLGGTNIAAGITDAEGKLLYKDSVPTGAERGFAAVMADMGHLIQSLMRQNNIAVEDCICAGIGSPGLPNNDTGYMSDNANLHWTDVPMRTELQKYIDLPVYMDNDANVAAWAEYLLGCGKGTKNFVAVTLGTGVGSGIVVNNTLYSGSHRAGAELGHILFEKDGYLCGCGKKGCVEKYCSATAIIFKAKELLATGKYEDSSLAKTDPVQISARTVIDAARAGDRLGKEVFDWYVDNMALFIVSIYNIFDPDVIALGGGVANAGDFLLAPLHGQIQKYLLIEDVPYGAIRIAEMGNDAGIIGAALLGK